VGGAYGINGRELLVMVWYENLKQDAQMEDLSIDGGIKMVFLKGTIEVLQLDSRQEKILLIFQNLQPALSHTFLPFNVSWGHLLQIRV
jgi:hypothetical protein